MVYWDGAIGEAMVTLSERMDTHPSKDQYKRKKAVIIVCPAKWPPRYAMTLASRGTHGYDAKRDGGVSVRNLELRLDHDGLIHP